MLNEITIENVAVIEKAIAEFDSGFTVLTGETGAGKSILIDSINAILGNRTSRDIVRSGSGKAKIWARFSNLPQATQAALEAAGYAGEEDLLIYREITPEGKSNCRINGLPATAGLLKEICGPLIAINGQHDSQSLLNPSRHLGILDAYAMNADLLAAYRAEYKKLRAVEKEIAALSMDEADKLRRIDLLQYEVDEIKAAALVPNEEDVLLEQRNVVRNAQQIMQSLNSAYLALSGGDEDTGATTLLGEAANEVSTAAQYVTELAEHASALQDTFYNLQEIASDLQSRLADFDFDAQALNDIEARLDIIYRLKQKYGATLEDVLNYAATAAEELNKIQFAAERIEALNHEKATLLQKAAKLAQQLTKSRTEAFEKLAANIIKALDFLNMPGIALSLQLQKTDLTATGQDELEFYISTNAGETPKPMAKIASGGELSRIMLAIKSAMAEQDKTPTVIYDEIDTGISGLAAGRIGRLLQATAKGHQVICVTHTAQVAAYANQHLLIQKNVDNGRTYTHIEPLGTQQRAEELARIMGGDNITETIKASAHEMLVKASENAKNT